MHDPKDYEIRLFYSSDPGDQCWIAHPVEWPSISAVGDTPEEAAREIQVALRIALESARDAGIEPPMPARLAHTQA